MRKLIVHKLSKKFMDIAYRTQSWTPTERNGWIIKFSIFNGDHILLLFTSKYTGQTVIREFNNEDDAVNFINYIIDLDSSEYNEI